MSVTGHPDMETDGSSREPSPGRITKSQLLAENEMLRAQIQSLEARLQEVTGELALQRKQSRIQHQEMLNAIERTRAGKDSPAVSTVKEVPKRKAPSESDGEETPRSQAKKKQPAATRVPQQSKETPTACLDSPTASQDANPERDEATKAAEEPKSPKITPVILRRKETWSMVSQRLKETRIGFKKARVIGDGIAIEPATIDDYRRMTRMFTLEDWHFHTFTLPEDRLLRVVIRGIPSGVSCEEVKLDLEEQGYAPASVQRMTSRRTKLEIPLMLVQVPLNQEKILTVTRCCSLVVRTERQRAKQAVTQCHRCQRFGHAQGKCTAQVKCVKCGEAHRTSDCPKKKEAPAKCANCQGAHPASYKGCPKYPKKPAAGSPQRPAQGTTQTPVSAPKRTVTPALSYARAAQGKAGPSTTPSKQQQRAPVEAKNLTAVLAQMQQMCSAMSAFFAQMPALTNP